MGEKKINREWVKTFAIIFLAVLLVLTFFSNTIMNMTLPEVSTEYIQYGSIKTQVRGSGTITASDNYSVTIPTTREILKVAVSKGTQVQKGDVLFYLAEGDSDELEAAKKTIGSNAKWYAAAQKVAEDNHLLTFVQGKMDAPITRYDMAAIMTNIMDAKEFSGRPGLAETEATFDKIADFKSIPNSYQIRVASGFARIQGDGSSD